MARIVIKYQVSNSYESSIHCDDAIQDSVIAILDKLNLKVISITPEPTDDVAQIES